MLKSIGSMYFLFTYIYRKNKPNVGNHTIHAFLWERTVTADFWAANFLKATNRKGVKLPLEENIQNADLCFPRDPGSPSENGFMEPKYLSQEVILHPNHHLRR